MISRRNFENLADDGDETLISCSDAVYLSRDDADAGCAHVQCWTIIKLILLLSILGLICFIVGNCILDDKIHCNIASLTDKNEVLSLKTPNCLSFRLNYIETVRSLHVWNINLFKERSSRQYEIRSSF
jgi:hypothetical protein